MENRYFIKRFYLNKADSYVLRMKLKDREKDWKQSEKNHTDKNKEKKRYFM